MNSRREPETIGRTTLGRLSYGAVEHALRALCAYHDYEVVGLENLPRSGPALVAFHHSLATYDSFLLGVPIKDRLGRVFRGLADRLIFRTPGLGRLFRDAGFVEGTREATRAMLAQGALIGFAPGGMRESLRSSRERHTFDWMGRLGFVWTSLLSGAPIVLAACPRADDLYTVVDNPITPWVYERVRAPLPLAFGRWGTPLPRPIKLWHLLSEPIWPDVAPDRVEEADVLEHHRRVVDRMQSLMRASLALSLDRARKGSPITPVTSS